MEKKTKAITITLTETNYNKVKKQAEKERRPLAQFIYLLVVDSLEGKR